MYEAMYIVNPALSETEVEALTERIKSEIVERGGKVADLQHLGKKRLAYAIGRNKDGFYFLLYFTLAPGRVAELTAGYRLNESILCFLIVTKKEQEARLAGEKAEENSPEKE